eukprot:5057339-Amphidinium_carterae.1
MGVDKYKEIDGKLQHLLRFISILCPINSYMRRLRGDVAHLPFIPQLGLVHLEDGESVSIDSEDMVPLSVCGGSPTDFAFVAIQTVPMGWISAVDLIQT